METRTATKLLTLALAGLVSGCATTRGPDDDPGTIVARAMRAHVKTMRDQIRADRNAIKAAFREAFGHQGTIVERSYPERVAVSPRFDSAIEPRTTQVAPYREYRERPIDVEEMRSIEMDVGRAEMITQEGTLHPRAARALARMSAMASENGGDFSVAVPRSQLHTIPAIRAVAPAATIVATDDDAYRLIVVTPDR